MADLNVASAFFNGDGPWPHLTTLLDVNLPFVGHFGVVFCAQIPQSANLEIFKGVTSTPVRICGAMADLASD